MKSYIKAISYYLPEKVLDNSELINEFPEWSLEKVSSKIGIRSRHISSSTETAGDMAMKASERLFDEYKILPREIDFILLCTQSPDYFLPTTSCILQDKLKIPSSSGALDFNLGCSGFVYGLALAKGLISASIAENVLLITSETYSKHLHHRDKVNRTIFGDAAAATLISTSGLAEILQFNLGTDGRGAKNLIVKTGAFRQKKITGNLKFDETGNPISDDFLFMDGSEIFSFTLSEIPKLVHNTLLTNKIGIDKIKLFIFHQANKYLMEFLRQKIKIDPDKFYYCLEDFGNTVSSTIPIAFKEALKEINFEKNDNVLLAGFGVGYSYAGTILRF
jgi:3-oxoacyl-[acyl-carrier-protein] synthase III